MPTPQPSAYPSPQFLREPPIKGKPPLDIVQNVYLPYLRYQLKRGAIPGESAKVLAVALGVQKRGPLTPEMVLCLQLLHKGSNRTPQMRKTLGFTAEVLRHIVNILRKRRLIHFASSPDRQCGLWSLTVKGREALAQHEREAKTLATTIQSAGSGISATEG